MCCFTCLPQKPSPNKPILDLSPIKSKKSKASILAFKTIKRMKTKSQASLKAKTVPPPKVQKDSPQLVEEEREKHSMMEIPKDEMPTKTGDNEEKEDNFQLQVLGEELQQEKKETKEWKIIA